MLQIFKDHSLLIEKRTLGLKGGYAMFKLILLNIPKIPIKPDFFVVALDFGIKQNMIRELAMRSCRVKVVPAQTSAKEILDENPDGILLSNGPGDPAACGALIENISQLIGRKPILGICLGHQLLALALGAKTFKLKFGHRGGNQPGTCRP